MTGFKIFFTSLILFIAFSCFPVLAQDYKQSLSPINPKNDFQKNTVYRYGNDRDIDVIFVSPGDQSLLDQIANNGTTTYKPDTRDLDRAYVESLIIDLEDQITSDFYSSGLTEQDYADMFNHGDNGFYGYDAGDGPYGYYSFVYNHQVDEPSSWLGRFRNSVTNSRTELSDFSSDLNPDNIFVVDVNVLARTNSAVDLGRLIAENQPNMRELEKAIDHNDKVEEYLDKRDLDDDRVVAADVTEEGDLVLFYYDPGDIALNY